MEELAEAAKAMSDDEKHKRLAELQAKRNKMNMSNRGDWYILHPPPPPVIYH